MVTIHDNCRNMRRDNMILKGQLRTSASRTPRRRTIVVVLLCLVGFLLFAPALLASVAPVSNKIQNPDFETGPGHFYPWFRDGTAGVIGDESCCGQHETF